MKASFLLRKTVKSLGSDAHIVVLRNKHGKNGCSLATFYTQLVFLYYSFFFLRTVSNKRQNVLVMLNRAHNAQYLHKECSTALWVSSLHLGEDGWGESNESYRVPPDHNSFTLSLIMTSEGLPLVHTCLSKRPSRHVLNT